MLYMKLKEKIKGLRIHPLIQVLADNKGNPRTLALIEPLWGIPYNLISPFATLYMYTQGITDVQIGLILSITMVAQVLFSFFGGLFLAAALLNCFEQINQTAWYCLLIEDAHPKDLVGIYTWVNIGGLVAIFFAPLSGLFVSSYSIVPVVRVLYILFALTMLTKTLITFRFCHETRQGKIRRAETKGVSILHMLEEYRQLIPGLLKNKSVLKAVAVSVILYITNMVSTNFFGLYVTQRLGLSENFLALFPILNAAVMLIFMVGFQHRMNATKFRIPLWVGLALYAAAALVLILSPANSLGFVLLYVFLAAVAAALVNPRKDALLQLNITPQERARINALIIAATIALSSPFGYLAGWLSSMDRRLPFAFTLLLFITAMLVISRIHEPQVTEKSS